MEQKEGFHNSFLPLPRPRDKNHLGSNIFPYSSHISGLGKFDFWKDERGISESRPTIEPYSTKHENGDGGLRKRFSPRLTL